MSDRLAYSVSEAAMSDKPYTVKDLARRWGCTPQAVYSIIKTGKLRTFRVGGKLLRIQADEVRRWESGGESTASETTGSGNSTTKPLSSGKMTRGLTVEGLVSSLPK